MLKKVKDTLSQFNMISSGEIVVAGVSGGADSVALFYNLCEYRKIVDFELKVVHVNHLIRDDAADDAIFVEELCKQNNVEYHLFEINIEKMAEEEHLSTEEAGRIARYKAMRGLKADHIAVGHHRDDQAETVLLNMCRGTGLHGMKGIAPIQGDIIRPLLFVSRDEIEKYLETKNQSFHIDSTNLTTDYVRNRLRHIIIPDLKKEINEKADVHIAELATDMCELEQYISELVNSEYQKLCKPDKACDEIQISIAGLESLNIYMRRELVLRMMEELTPRRKDITRTHIGLILDLCNSDGSKSIDLPYNLEVVKIYDNLVIRKRKEKQKKDIYIELTDELIKKESSLKIGKSTVLKMRVYDKVTDFVPSDNKYTKCLDYDKINCSLVVRNRREGDFLVVSDKGSKKSLKDYMINEKIPREERDNILLIADGNQIMWVIGYRIGATYKVTDKTKRILEINVSDND